MGPASNASAGPPEHSSGGDVNGDGFDDLIVGSHQADPNGSDSGSSYVVFGGNFTGGTETQVGGATANTLTAVNGAALDVLIGGGGNDTLISDGGPDVLFGEGDDDWFWLFGSDTAPDHGGGELMN